MSAVSVTCPTCGAPYLNRDNGLCGNEDCPDARFHEEAPDPWVLAGGEREKP